MTVKMFYSIGHRSDNSIMLMRQTQSKTGIDKTNLRIIENVPSH